MTPTHAPGSPPEHTIVDDATALAMLADHEIDLRQLALIADDMQNSTADLGNAEGFPADATPNIQMTQLAPSHLGVQVKDANAPLLVISENWMPGWQTSPPLPLVRTDLTLIGIVLPEPTVEFELIYRPDSVRLGLLISGVTLLLVGLAVIAGLLLRSRLTLPWRYGRHGGPSPLGGEARGASVQEAKKQVRRPSAQPIHSSLYLLIFSVRRHCGDRDP